jgi:ketosteroid isomerase-like protein
MKPVVTAVLVFLFVAVLASCQKQHSVEGQTRALLDQQAEAWNRGDIEGFMQTYWKSDQTVFVGASGVTRGWQAVLERYKHTYPDRRAMGTLRFSGLEVTPLSPDSAVILGHWELQRESGHPAGFFTLIVRKLPEGWRIIHDHTSTGGRSN